MIRKWVKILPYFIILKIIKQFSGDWIHTEELGLCRGWNIDKDEFIIVSKNKYNYIKKINKNQSNKDKNRCPTCGT
ncbi:MAG: hypothetical protein ACOCP8_05000 [archaeon]